MPRGASSKREREYKELKKEFKKEGRYKGREEEVASRIVNKQRKKAQEPEDPARAAGLSHPSRETDTQGRVPNGRALFSVHPHKQPVSMASPGPSGAGHSEEVPPRRRRGVTRGDVAAPRHDRLAVSDFLVVGVPD